MLVDLSQPFESGMQTYPGDPSVALEPWATVEDDDCRVTAVSAGSHAGTHVDAPSHTEPDGDDLDAFDVAAFRFDARLVDVTDLGARDAVVPDRVPDVVDADLLAFRTGWDRHWGEPRYLDHPYLARETAAACAERGCHVAIDALSPDRTPGDSDGEHLGDEADNGGVESDDCGGFGAHHELLGAGHLVVENLAGLERVPERFTLHAYPLPLPVDGAPVRAVAEFDE